MKRSTNPFRRLQQEQGGLTLIELGIALLIVGLLFMAVVPSIEGVTGVRAREAAGHLTGVVRYMYNESALSGRSCRLVFDLDAKAYWAECAQGAYTVESTREEARNGAKAKDPEEDEKLQRELEESSNVGFTDDDAAAIKAEKERILKRADFSDFTDDTVGKTALPKDVDLAVWVDHQREKYTKGKAYLYFFPQGYTERAQLYLSTGSTIYTLKVAPLTGKVKVFPDELELPRDVR